MDNMHHTTRSKMEKYMRYVREMEQSEMEKAKYRKEKAELESTPAYKQSVVRRKLLQTLDTNNRINKPEQRIENTKEFMLNTLECIYNEVNALDHKLTNKEAKDFMFNYRIHYQVIQQFDNEVGYNKELGYTRDLQLEFLEKLSLIEPKLMNYFIKEEIIETII